MKVDKTIGTPHTKSCKINAKELGLIDSKAGIH